MKTLPWLLIVLLAIAVLFLWNRHHESSPVNMDTLEYVETIPYYYPVPKDTVITRYKTVKLPVKEDSCKVKKDYCGAKQDSCVSSDSANVVIPITHKEYEDSLYHIWVSGYDVILDSIKLKNRIREIKVPITVPVKRKRWGLGIQAGYSYPGGIYVGLGVSYNILVW